MLTFPAARSGNGDCYSSLPALGFWLPVQGLLIAWAYWYTRE